MLIRIIEDTGPGCVFRPGSIVRMPDKKARKLIERGTAVPTGVMTKADVLQLEAKAPAKKKHRPLVGENLTSIVIPVFNQGHLLKRCLDSIIQKTQSPYEIIIVDNNSNVDTKNVIRSYNFKTVTNKDNLGFPKAVNQGILNSRGQRILLLNSDTIVSNGWLRKMVKRLDGDVGLVGPTTNYSCGPQCDRSIMGKDFSANMSGRFIDVEDVEGIAEKYQHNKSHIVDVLSGFCLLIDRRVISEIGSFDTCFGMGGAEERDFEDRAQIRGWKMAWAKNSYVHHFGHQSLKHVYKDVQKDGFKNHDLFLKRQKERRAKRRGIVVPFFDSVPIMFPTWFRIGYTKKAIENLLRVTPNCNVLIYDDGSTDGTTEYLDSLIDHRIAARVFNPERRGLDNNIDMFFSVTAGVEWVAKIDNDTIVPRGWLEKLISIAKNNDLDIAAPTHFHNKVAQQKYLNPQKRVGNIYLNVHVGGLGVIKREWVDRALDAGRTSYWDRYDKTPGGWTKFQETMPGKKAFCPSVKVKLLDEGENKQDYPNYHKTLVRERRKKYGRDPEPQ